LFYQLKVTSKVNIFKHATNQILEVSAMLWNKGWVESNGGNLSLNLSGIIAPDNNPGKITIVPLMKTMPELSGDIFYITGKGKRIRDVAKSPLSYGVIFRINSAGDEIEIFSNNHVLPSSELFTHLEIHCFFKKNNIDYKAIIHCHPAELIALSHIQELQNSDILTTTLWKMIPEARINIRKGIGFLPYQVSGSQKLADATVMMLDKYDIILWEKHGIISTGKDLETCFDQIDVLNKSAQIYLLASGTGKAPEGLNDSQLNELGLLC